MENYFQLFKDQIRKIAFILLFVMCVYLIFFLFAGIIGESSFHFFTVFPLFTPFIHTSLSHFSENLIMLFILSLPPINRLYSTRQLILVAIAISVIYLPFVLFNISDPVVGLSGLGYFLLTRFVFSNHFYSRFFIVFFSLVIIGEFFVIGSADDVAHGFHLFAAGCGFVSQSNKFIQINIYMRRIEVYLFSKIRTKT